MRTTLVLAKLSLASLSLVALAFGAGCSAAAGEGTGSSDQPIGDPGQGAPAAPAWLVGTYRNAGAVGYEHFASITLKEDATFEASREIGPLEIRCIRAPCTHAVSGTWTAREVSGVVRVTIVIGSRTAAVFRALAAADGGPVTLVAEDGKGAALPGYALVSERAAEPEGKQCFSSASEDCAADEYCTVETGDCRSAGMLAVCAGVCKKAGLGEPHGMCGGFAGIRCADASHECVLSASHPDASGRCLPKGAGAR